MQNSGHKSVSIILLNYNSYQDTIECVESLQRITYENYNVIIVDNNSPDNSMTRIWDYMKKRKLNVIYYASPEKAMNDGGNCAQFILIQTGCNGGYGYGNNIGIKYALSKAVDYVLLLNNDTIVTPCFLQPLLQTYEEGQNVGLVSGKIYYYDAPNTIWFNGGEFYPLTSRVKHLYFNEKDIGQKPPEENTFITGCMWLISAKILEDVGYINEDYFMYVEDLEYCQRVLERGYSLKVNDKSIVFHKAAGSSGGHWSEFSIYWMSRNSYKFIQLNAHGIRKLTSLFVLLFFKPLKWLKKGRFKLIKEHFKGIYDGSKS